MPGISARHYILFEELYQISLFPCKKRSANHCNFIRAISNLYSFQIFCWFNMSFFKVLFQVKFNAIDIGNINFINIFWVLYLQASKITSHGHLLVCNVWLLFEKINYILEMGDVNVNGQLSGWNLFYCRNSFLLGSLHL